MDAPLNFKLMLLNWQLQSHYDKQEIKKKCPNSRQIICPRPLQLKFVVAV